MKTTTPAPERYPEKAATGDTMTEQTPPIEGVPETAAATDYGAVIEQLKSANVALMDKVKALEQRAAASEQRIAAFGAQPAPAQAKTDAAFEKALAELGIKIQK